MPSTQLSDVLPPGGTEVSLVIGGMTCGACAAGIERRLNGLDGVVATVNFASERARVQVGPDVPVQMLVDEIHSAGYSADLVDDQEPLKEQDTEADRRVRSLGRRLVVAAALFLPLCDLSIAFWLIPAIRFPGWQWILIALAAPVLTWGAWPFYSAAVRHARHGTYSMDTLRLSASWPPRAGPSTPCSGKRAATYTDQSATS